MSQSGPTSRVVVQRARLCETDGAGSRAPRLDDGGERVVLLARGRRLYKPFPAAMVTVQLALGGKQRGTQDGGDLSAVLLHCERGIRRKLRDANRT